MASVTWQPATSGAWNVASNWKNNAAPNTNDDAFITIAGASPYTVALATASKAIDSLTINATSATLSIASTGSLSITGSGAGATDALNLTAGNVQISGGVITATSIVFGGANGTLQGSGTVTGVVSGSGGILSAKNGTLKLESNVGASTGLNFRIEDAGTSVLQIDGTLGDNNTFTFVGNTNDSFAYNNAGGIKENFASLNVGSSATTPTNFIDFMNHTVTVVGGNKGTGTSGTISLSDGSVLTLSGIANGGSGWFVDTKSDGVGGTEVFLSTVVCYVSGTMIAIEAGETVVEDLQIGDLVRTASGKLQAVKWTGHRRIDLSRHPDPLSVVPVRIERDAFADNVPRRDLLLSPDHAVFVDDKLICVRQLVNGTTIRREKDWSSVDYYHVELNEHAILLAEGLPAESYLDTGNRGFFANAGVPLVLHPDLTDETDNPTREGGSCAPFVWDEASVRPAWQRLADRADVIGRAAPVRATTTEAAPRLQCTDGRTIEPIHRDGDRVIFVLPHDASEVRLVSRAQAPTEARPWLTDQRRLGVRVKRIVLSGAEETREVPMDHPDFARGWWDIEQDGPMMSRWTDGAAVLPLPPMRGPAMLEIHLAGAMTFVEDAVPEDVIERRAA